MPISLSPAVEKTLLVWVGRWMDINQHFEITVANRLLLTYHNFKGPVSGFVGRIPHPDKKSLSTAGLSEIGIQPTSLFYRFSFAN